VRQLLHTSALKSVQSTELSRDDMLDHLVRLSLDVQGAAEAGQMVHPETAKELAAVAAGAQAVLGSGAATPLRGNSDSGIDQSAETNGYALGTSKSPLVFVSRKTTGGSSGSGGYGDGGNGMGLGEQYGGVGNGVMQQQQVEEIGPAGPTNEAELRTRGSSRGGVVEAAESLSTAGVTRARSAGGTGAAAGTGAGAVAEPQPDGSVAVGPLQLDGVRQRHQGGNGQEAKVGTGSGGEGGT
jgi:hypothetical protein